jgi:hypothetical protein
MTNDRVIKERIREFQIGKDYSVSVEDDGKKKVKNVIVLFRQN